MKVKHQGHLADHHVFVVPGVVDGRVVADQAQRRLTKFGVSTYIHQHAKEVLVNGEVREATCNLHEHDEVGNIVHLV